MAFDKEYDYIFKLLIIGDSHVGKSSLLLRLSDNNFDPDFNTTIGIDFKIKMIELEDKIIKLQIWDSAGQDRFRTITTMYYRNSNGVIIMYDVTERTSFQNIEIWLQELEKYAHKDIPKIIVGGKTDLKNDRKVSYEEAREYADSLNIPYIETSSKEDKNIDETFELISKEIKRLHKNFKNINIKLKDEKNRNCFVCEKCY